MDDWWERIVNSLTEFAVGREEFITAEYNGWSPVTNWSKMICQNEPQAGSCKQHNYYLWTFFVRKANSGGASGKTIGCAACRCWTKCRRKTFGCQLWVLGNAIFLRIHGHESENNELHGNDFQHVRRGGGTSAKIWCRIMWGWGASVSRWWMRMMHYFQKICRNPNKNIGKVNVRNCLRCFRRNTSDTSQSLCRQKLYIYQRWCFWDQVWVIYRL